MKNSELLFFLFLTYVPLLMAQNSSIVIDKNKDQFVFGQIYADFKNNFNNEIKPVAAFRFNRD